MKKSNIICTRCGTVLTEDCTQYFGDQILCDDCYERSTTTCDNCGEVIWREDVEGDSNYTLCRRCYDDYYTNCEECGTLIHTDNAYYEDGDDYPYCHDCFQKLQLKPIKQYSYKPEPMFYGSGNLFLGIELEIDRGGELDSNAKTLMDIANYNGERIYCKHDGSIDCGFEIVSHPMTLDYHTNKMNWSDVFNKAINMNYLSHKTKTCGLHIHVSRSAFGDNFNDQEDAISRVVYFIENNWNELVKFSRRTIDNLNRWASRYGISENTKDTYKKAKDKRLGRYVAVNLENYNTIEFRIFRGTLRYETFIATLQLVDEICNLAIYLTVSEIESLSWSNFVSGINKTDKKELIEYLKSKRLYVNETTLESEEM